jgi:hypothetical protein
MLRFYDLNVDVVEGATDNIRNHISRTILGTPGGLLYRLVDSVNKLDKVGRLIFMTLSKGTRLLGTVGFVHRLVHNGDKMCNAYYIRYFSIFAPLRLKKYKSRKERQKKPGKAKEANLLKQNFIKEKVLDFFDNMPQLNQTEKEKTLKTLSYAYIEKKNLRSIDFSSMMGYETIREFVTIEFSRFFPKKNKLVDRVKPKEKNEILKKLNDFYKDHTLFYTDNIFYKDQYFVLKEDGEIVAGVQANCVEWEVLEMPGKNGELIMKVVPKIPLISRLFQPHNFRFAAFEGIWYKNGYEKSLLTLFESTCAMLDLNVGLSWFDSESPVLQDINRSGGLGLLNKVMASHPAAIRVRFFDYPWEEKLKFSKMPVYISAFDMT